MNRTLSRRLLNVADKLKTVKSAKLDTVANDLYENLRDHMSALRVELGIEHEDERDNFLAVQTLNHIVEDAQGLITQLKRSSES